MRRRSSRARKPSRPAAKGGSPGKNDFLLLTAAVIAVFIVFYFYIFGPADISGRTKAAERAVNESLAQAKVPASTLSFEGVEKIISGRARFQRIIREYKADDRFPVINFRDIIRHKAQAEGLSVKGPDYIFGKDLRIIKFDLYSQRYKVYSLKFKQEIDMQAPEVPEESAVALKPVERPAEKPAEKPIEKPKPAPKPVVRPKPAPKVEEKPKVVEKPKVEEKPRIAEKPKPVEKPKVVEKPAPVKVVAPVVKPPRKPKPKIIGRIAIVLDDWGYNKNNLPALKQIGRPLTLAVLPHLPYTKEAATQGHKAGCEIILHMPMQPMGGNNATEQDTIRVDMSDDQILDLLNSSMASVPYIRGVSNHQGSRATSDERTMEVVMRRLRQRGLFFLDSYSSNQSICEQEAEKTGLGFAKRDVFLDNVEDHDSIQQQLEAAYERAVEKGECIAIGHDRPMTLKVLQEMIPELEQRGIKFVRVSEFVR